MPVKAAPDAVFLQKLKKAQVFLARRDRRIVEQHNQLGRLVSRKLGLQGRLITIPKLGYRLERR